jgi:cysteine synthase A
MIYNDILETIGHTPVVRLNRVGPEHVNLFAKIEFFNPMASVKDRLAIGIIEDAERRGVLKPGQTVVEATSGNTGIALAMVCAAKGYPFVSFMVETFSIERRKLMRAMGAKVILTPKEEKGTGMVKRAAAAAERNGWFLARQFENDANPEYHRNTTGPEILRDFAGHGLDYFVTGWGTGGTMTGAGEMLKLARPNIKVIATEPETAQLMAGKEWAPHKIQGWTPDFIPKIMNTKIADEIVPVTDDESRDVARELAAKEGIMTGVSGGGTVAAALKVAAQAPKGSNILAMIPDTGERYISTYLFEGINEESDDDWLIENGYADAP